MPANHYEQHSPWMECTRCFHLWVTRIPGRRPKQCPQCKSQKWDSLPDDPPIRDPVILTITDCKVVGK